MSSTVKTVDPILLQFIAEYHQGLNELAGHGSAIDQAKAALRTLLLEWLPAKKHHIESDRNIAYREGFNDATELMRQYINEVCK